MLFSRLLAAALPALFLLPATAAEQALAPKPPVLSIHKTSAPGGPFGFWGPDLSVDQKVAARFTVGAADLQLARIALYLMNNSDTQQGLVRLSLQTDALDEGGSETLPSGSEIESWTMPVQALGWNPVQQSVTSIYGAHLQAGKNYWVVAESASLPTQNPVWNFASKGTGYSTTSVNGVWQTAGSAAALTLNVSGTAMGTGRLPEVYMSLSSSTIVSGDRALMSWDTSRARRCYAFGDWSGQWSTDDSVYVSPPTPGFYYYHLTCTNGSGRSGATVQLQVVGAK